MELEFTDHAGEQMFRRNIPIQDVLDTLDFPDAVLKREGQYFAMRDVGRGVLTVVFERTTTNIKVITLWWR